MKNNVIIDGELLNLSYKGDVSELYKFQIRVPKIGVRQTSADVTCLVFGRNAKWADEALETIDIGETVRVKGSLRIEGDRSVVMVDTVRPIFHREG